VFNDYFNHVGFIKYKNWFLIPFFSNSLTFKQFYRKTEYKAHKQKWNHKYIKYILKVSAEKVLPIKKTLVYLHLQI